MIPHWKAYVGDRIEAATNVTAEQKLLTEQVLPEVCGPPSLRIKSRYQTPWGADHGGASLIQKSA